MKKTFLKILYGMTVIGMLAGCGKKEAQEILLQESAAEETVEEPQKEMAQSPEPEATPIIQVECNCQCHNQAGVPAGTAAGDTQATAADQTAASETQAAEGTAVSGDSQTQGQPGTADGKVNINTADLAQLQTLSGIGEVRALAIISHRETYGAFQSIEEIKNVSGIKDAVFEKIKDDISVG